MRGLYPKCGGKRKIFGKALKSRPMSAISANVRAANARLSAACRAAGRPADAVRLVAVAKTFPAGFAREAFAAGCRDIGENYLQEAQAKMAELQDLPIEWHFVGIPQARKAAAVARLFDWAHGVDEVRVAEKMSAARGETDKPPLNVFFAGQHQPGGDKRRNRAGRRQSGGDGDSAAAAFAFARIDRHSGAGCGNPAGGVSGGGGVAGGDCGGFGGV